jgi:hypothetical protein
MHQSRRCAVCDLKVRVKDASHACTDRGGCFGDNPLLVGEKSLLVCVFRSFICHSLQNQVSYLLLEASLSCFSHSLLGNLVLRGRRELVWVGSAANHKAKILLVGSDGSCSFTNLGQNQVPSTKPSNECD